MAIKLATKIKMDESIKPLLLKWLFLLRNLEVKKEINILNEITRADANSLEKFRAQNRVYETSVYAFTFEQAYLIYYYKRAAGKENFQYDYIAIDINTGLNSHVCTRKSVLLEGDFKSIIPDIIHSIKYAVDKRNALAPRSLK